MNIVEFGIKLKDMASGALLKFAQTVKSTTATSSASVNKTTSAIAETGKKAAETQRSVKQMAETTATGFSKVTEEARKAGKEIDNVKQKADKASKQSKGNKKDKGSSAWDYVKGSAIYGGITAAGNMAAGFFADSIQAGLDRQKIQTSFNVLAGSEDTGKELTRQLVDLQQSTILGSEVFGAAQTMMGFGFNALKSGEDDIKSVTENLKMLGDVSMGDKEHLNGLALVYSQVCAAGKMNTQDLYQFINNGWNPLEQMSKSTGKSISQLKDEIAEGKITFDKVHESLVQSTSAGGKFNNMLGEIAKTPFGKMQQLNGAWEEFKIKAGQAFTPLVSFALELANKLLPYLEKMLTPLSNGIAKVVDYIKAVKPILMQVFSPVAEFVGGIVAKVQEFFAAASEKANVFMQYVNAVKDTIVNHVWPVVQQVVEFVGDMIGQLYDFISQSQLLADIFSAIQSFISTVYDAVGDVITVLKWVFDNVIMAQLNRIEKVYRWVKDLIGSKSVASAAANVPVTSAPVVAKPTAKTLDEKKSDSKNTEVLKTIADNTKSNNASADKAAKSVASSGPKVVNISLGKFFDNIVFNTTNLEESASKIESVVTECLSRILLDGAKTV